MPGTTNIPGEWKAHGVIIRGIKSSQALHFWSDDLGQVANLNFDFLVHDMGIVSVSSPAGLREFVEKLQCCV